MAGYGWNMHHNLNHSRKRPYLSPQIACRICDQVFMSTEALINHIETHMMEDESVFRRQHEINLMLSQRDRHFMAHPNPYQPNIFSTPTPLRPPFPSSFVNPQALQRLPFPVPTTTAPPTPSSRIFRPCPIPPPSRARKIPFHGPQLPLGYTDMSQLPPYLTTMGAAAEWKPLAPNPPTNVPYLPRPQLGRKNEDNNKKSTPEDTETLDLTLRL
ncbi:hypothetical protein ACOSP7_006716 [Xanthoceras sorbifolium]|uniref:C2H2-type domain-containing protein n=1 Tax=Xanthoceras sorbifolium TaxID=99658 RepID=A0ABQ8I9A0_9ROSI|nr:hypothetical protein JRO89_XS03G0092100 [Xanthoceras sorbifolium]